MNDFYEPPEDWRMKNVGAAGQYVYIGKQYFGRSRPAATKELIGERDRILEAIKRHQAFIGFFNLVPMIAGIGMLALMEHVIGSSQSKPTAVAYGMAAITSLTGWYLVWSSFSEKRKHRSQVVKSHRARLVELDAELERRP